MDEVLEQLRVALAERYTIEREIGRGGMATVYLATEEHPRRDVAIKVLSPDIATIVMRERFLREIDVVSKLTHPHIVPVFAAGDADGLLYYVMPFIRGESLAHLIARDGPLPVGMALKIAQEVAEALSYAHGEGVIHRDIKPANILIHDNHALVADFGIARAVGTAGKRQLTQAGIALGTPAYMSPEQWSATEDVDGRSDIYSLACVLLEALGGTPSDKSPPARVDEVAHVVRAAAGSDRVTGGLTGALKRALAPKPSERFHDAAAFADALNRSDPGRVSLEMEAKRHHPTRGGLLVMLIIVFAAIIIGTQLPLGESPAGNITAPRVVVATFENQTGDPGLTPIGSMAADWVTQGLAQTGLVEVSGNLTALTAADDDDSVATGSETIQTLADQSGADVVVWGRYYKQGSNIQFQGQITDVREQTLLSALTPIVAPVDSPLVGIEELRQKVMGSLALHFDERLNHWALVTNRPPSYGAYREYMEGMAIFMQQLNPGMAIPHLLRAGELDSSFVTPVLFAAFASATGGGWEFADSIAHVVDSKRDQLIPFERSLLDWIMRMTRGQYDSALESARALSSASPSAEMFTLEGMTALQAYRPREALEAFDRVDPADLAGFFMHWNYVTSALHFLGEYRRELTQARRGLELYPGNQFLIVNVARALVGLGRPDDAIEALGDYPSAPPMPWVAAGEDAWIVSTEMMVHGLPEEAAALQSLAIEWFESLNPDTLAKPLYRYSYARNLYVTGRLDDAERHFRALAEEIPDSVSFRGYLGSIAARRGDRDRAVSISDSLVTLDRRFRFGSIPYWQARIAAVLGDTSRAVSKLRQAFNEGFQNIDMLHHDEDLLLLRGYEPFDELLRPKG